MFEMIIFILHFSLSRNNKSRQEFQSTCPQEITHTAITNVHLFVFYN